MNRLPLLNRLLAVTALLISLAACNLELPRTDRSGEISVPAEFVPTAIAATQAETGPVIRLEPASQQLNVGNITNVDILIDNITDLFAVSFELSFEPTVLQVRDADPAQDGIQIELGNFLSPDFVAENKADNASGHIFFALTEVGTSPPASGSGRLATINFEAVAQGGSQLTFSEVKLVRVTSGGVEQIPVTVQHGQIVVGQPTGQPTATPTATATATSTLQPGQNTPTPTSTPQTATPALTFTPSPTPTPTSLPTFTPTPTPVPLADIPELNIPATATEGFCYRVQEGETLYSLGQKFGVDAGYLNLVNDLNPSGYVYLHQALFIPTVPGSGPNVYRVKIGDTLVKIADDCHLPVDFLAQVNRIKIETPLYLKQGETALLKDGTLYTTPADEVILERLFIPLPPFAPPSRYPYPGSVAPPIPPGCNTYPPCY
ncbi:MAG: LysM peptidoglycan-binding domain-containing protein [Chloroflexota bacterium]